MEQDIRFCTTDDGVRIAYTTMGEGPPLLWVSGWLSHLELDLQFPPTRERCERLAADFTLVRLDKRGTGLSQRGISNFSLDAHVLDVEAVVAALELKRFALVGNSEGGPISLRYTETHQELVSHLTLVSTFATTERLAGGPEMQQAVLSITKQQWGLASTLLAEMLFGEAVNPSVQRLFAAYQQQAATADDAARSWEFAMEIDVTASLPKITAKTLVLHGRDDRAIPIDCGQELAAGIKGARFLSFDGNHVPDQEQAAQMDLAIREFVLEDAADRRGPRSTVTAPPGGLVTILFTDMENSTALTQRLGDAEAQELVRRHNTVVRDALEAHSGSEVKHTGDGIMASFPVASGALACAVAIQRGLAEENANAETAVRVRIGLSAGEPVAEEGDLFGSTVQLAARVCAKADAGQIMVSNVVRELAMGKGFLFADLGDFVPKGFEDPVHVYEVSWS